MEPPASTLGYRTHLALLVVSIVGACGRTASTTPPLAHPVDGATESLVDASEPANATGRPLDASFDAEGLDAADASLARPRLAAGRYKGRGLWGVHQTGTLLVRVDDTGCTATYGAEGSYFCGTTHTLRCEVHAEGSEVHVVETSCVRSCMRDHGSQENCAGPFGVHGVLRVDPTSDLDAGGPSARFFLTERFIQNLKKYKSNVESLPMAWTAP